MNFTHNSVLIAVQCMDMKKSLNLLVDNYDVHYTFCNFIVNMLSYNARLVIALFAHSVTCANHFKLSTSCRSLF